MNLTKKIQWSLAIYLLIGLIYAIFSYVRNSLEYNFSLIGWIALKVFFTNMLFFPFVIISTEIFNTIFRVEFWWFLLIVFIVVGFIIEVIYKVTKFEIKFLRLHKVIKHSIIIGIFILLVFTFNIPLQHSIKYNALETINYKDVIQNLNDINEATNQSFAVGFSFPIAYFTDDEINMLKFKENYSEYDIMLIEFENKWIIQDDFDYYGKNASRLRARYKFDDLSTDEMKEKLEEQSELYYEQRDLFKTIDESKDPIVPYEELINVFVLSSEQTSAILKSKSAGNHTFGFFSYDNGSSLYLNYDLLQNYSEGNEVDIEFQNTMIHEITHYFYLTGKLGDSKFISDFYNLDSSKVDLFNQPVAKEIEDRKNEPSTGILIEFYSPNWIETQNDLVAYETLFNETYYDIENEQLRRSVNFTSMYMSYGASQYDDEIIARINALCLSLDPLTNYNTVKINDYEMCKQYNFSDEYLDLYDTFIQELIYNYYNTFIEYKKYQEIIDIDLDIPENDGVVIIIGGDEDGE